MNEADDEHHLRRVLLGVRLVGFGPPAEVARRADLDENRVTGILQRAEVAAWVAARHGHFAGWSLTTEGRRRGEALLRSELDALGAHDAVTAAFDRFLVLNADFLRLCTDWQLKRAADDRFVPNDHDDPDYDAEVIARLGATDEAIGPVVEELAAVLVRFGGYRPRLLRVLELVRAGDHDWFTRPVIDSYHTVWFELHEDLLATLGLERGAGG